MEPRTAVTAPTTGAGPGRTTAVRLPAGFCHDPAVVTPSTTGQRGARVASRRRAFAALVAFGVATTASTVAVILPGSVRTCASMTALAACVLSGVARGEGSWLSNRRMGALAAAARLPVRATIWTLNGLWLASLFVSTSVLVVRISR
jgi:hypothetical protein